MDRARPGCQAYRIAEAYKSVYDSRSSCTFNDLLGITCVRCIETRQCQRISDRYILLAIHYRLPEPRTGNYFHAPEDLPAAIVRCANLPFVSIILKFETDRNVPFAESLLSLGRIRPFSATRFTVKLAWCNSFWTTSTVTTPSTQFGLQGERSVFKIISALSVVIYTQLQSSFNSSI